MTNSDQNHGRPPMPVNAGYPHRPAAGQQPYAPENYDARYGVPAAQAQHGGTGGLPQQLPHFQHGNPAYPQEQSPYGVAPNVHASAGQGGYVQMQPGAGGGMPAAGGSDYYYPQGQQSLPELPAYAMPPATHPHSGAEGGLGNPMRMPAFEPGAPTYHTGPEGYHPTMGNQFQPQMDYGQPNQDQGAVQQISQRLAQLQSQYEVDVAQNDPRFGHAHVDQAAGGYGNPGQYYPQQAYQLQPGQMPPQAYANAAAPDHSGYYEPGQTYAPPADQNHGYGHQSYEPAYSQQQAGDYHGAHSAPHAAEHAAHHQQEGHAPFAAGTVIAHHVPSGKGSKSLAMAGAFIGALAIGGGAAYIYKFTDLLGAKGTDVAAPVVKAGAVPVKVVNGQAAEKRDAQNRPLHERMAGNGEESNGASDRLAPAGSETTPKIASAATGMLPKVETSDGTADTGAPRRVKTLIVRPDGTIVQPTDSPDERPAVAAGQREAQQAAVELAPSAPAAREAATKPAAKKPEPADVSVKKTETPKTVAANDKVAGKQTVPAIAPRANPEQEPKQIKTAAVDANSAVSTGGGSASAAEVGEPYVVQVTSKDSPTSALAAFADLQQKYPSLIGTYEPDIERADLGDKGVWYRLRVGPVAGKTAASDLCSRLKAAGHAGCFARRK